MNKITTVKETHVEYCRKCGKILYVIGRELTTGDIMCNCHKRKETTGFNYEQ